MTLNLKVTTMKIKMNQRSLNILGKQTPSPAIQTPSLAIQTPSLAENNSSIDFSCRCLSLITVLVQGRGLRARRILRVKSKTMRTRKPGCF